MACTLGNGLWKSFDRNMRELIYVLSVVGFITSCSRPERSTEKLSKDNFDCDKGLMKSAWYEHGVDERIPEITGLNAGFLIFVDTTLTATNFISFKESYRRKESTSLDTADLQWVEDWEQFSVMEKLEKVKEERSKSKERADSIHRANNQGQQQIWIINNSEYTVTVQMQDWLFICVLQAKARNEQWYPIEYWRLSTCGNSYYRKTFLPMTANSFITARPVEGNFKTKLRYKILGSDKFFYSNEFDGRIDFCSFVEDSSSYAEETRQPLFKLDSLIDLTL